VRFGVNVTPFPVIRGVPVRRELEDILAPERRRIRDLRGRVMYRPRRFLLRVGGDTKMPFAMQALAACV